MWDGDVAHHHDPELRFCPVCGGRLNDTALKLNEPSRLVCTECAFVYYLDPKVVACALVERDGAVALLKRDIEPQKGKWVMPGGYVDRGEPVETAAVRETLEECGLTIRIGPLLGAYSYPGKLAVVIVYVAGVLAGELHARDETAEAEWFAPEAIPWEELAFQSTKDALMDYCRTKGYTPWQKG
jgi:8-oxo-dGTP diphosphatase